MSIMMMKLKLSIQVQMNNLEAQKNVKVPKKENIPKNDQKVAVWKEVDLKEVDQKEADQKEADQKEKQKKVVPNEKLQKDIQKDNQKNIANPHPVGHPLN